ncbi:HesA/MoeB/ThiF family protein [Idiomarina seosinensis]|uniref:Molybdopterin-synthase adenylyltransferase MoeB n=1 Tax=Idiomarina seosinensis TaxID=281739 RepID=A0A432ZDN8_9GAMM|nr:molybdopterin-synthase adenylyltransferase MoeB [Idiomarina seosinensis]RUO76083.1 molybdopterin-synthase adenylyltransferase MoeB [Idiomarina seosinensis]
MKTLNHEQMLRYNRHIVLPAIDLEGQEKLLNSHAVVVGAGGLGCAALPYLAASGVGKLTIFDHDQVELSNLQRQPLYGEQNVGQPKAVAAMERLKQLNSGLHVSCYTEKADTSSLHRLASSATLVIDCSDNLTTRNQLNQFCYQHKIPLISGAAIRFEGQVMAFSMQHNSPCYQCLSLLFGEQALSCAESGVASPLVGIIGAMQALEAIKLLSGAGTPLFNTMLMYDGLAAEWQRFNIAKHPRCPVCH